MRGNAAGNEIRNRNTKRQSHGINRQQGLSADCEKKMVRTVRRGKI